MDSAQVDSASRLPKHSGGSRFGRSAVMLVVSGLLWAGFVSYLALQPDPPRVPGLDVTTVSNIGHFVVLALSTAWFYLFLRRPLHIYTAISGVLAFLVVGVLFGVGLELAQDRLSDVRVFQRRDIIANLFGSATAAVLFRLAELSGTSWFQLRMTTAGLSILVIAGSLTAGAVWNSDGPFVGDHWHAQYVVVICGEPLDPFPAFNGGIHSHGDRLIHIHPFTSRTAEENANLARFFHLAGGELTNHSITLPDGRSFEDGDPCGGQTAELTLFEFDVPTRERVRQIGNPADYVPRDSDTLIIEFGADQYDFSVDRRVR